MREGDGRYPWVQLRYVAKTGTGHTPSRTRPELWIDAERVHPWFTLADVSQLRDGKASVVTQTAENVSPAGLANSSAELHPAGTVLLSRTASVGFSAVMGAPMAVSQDFMTWTPGPRLRSRFLLYVLRAMRGDFGRLMYGSTHKTIYMPDLHAIRGPLPPVDAQNMIADFLDRECERISALGQRFSDMDAGTEELVARIRHEHLRRGDLQQCLGNGSWPQGWPSLRHVVDRFLAGGTPDTDKSECWAEAPNGFPWVSIGDMSSGQVTSTERRVSKLGVRQARLQLAPAGTLLLAMYASVGAIAQLEEDSYFNQALVGLWISDPLERWRVRQWLNVIRADLTWFAKSSTQPNLSANTVRCLPVPPVSREDLVNTKKMISRAEALSTSTAAAGNEASSALTEYRDALITEAVTGQLDVSKASEAQMHERAHAASEGRLGEAVAT